MDSSNPLREQLVRVLGWEEAHVGFDKALDGIPTEQRGASAAGFAYTLWQLLEHLRVAQKDILEFCINPRYVHELTWPDDYWPKTPGPPNASAWDRSITDFKADRNRLKTLVSDSRIDLFAVVPTGKERQTYLRAVLLLIDHNAYHVGQIVALRKALGSWR